MKCPNCNGTNLSASGQEAPRSSKIAGSRLHQSLGKTGHPVAALIVGGIQIGNAVRETFGITYTCQSCGRRFNKFKSWVS